MSISSAGNHVWSSYFLFAALTSKLKPNLICNVENTKGWREMRTATALLQKRHHLGTLSLSVIHHPSPNSNIDMQVTVK